jgi:bacillithiol system protein YtxJ
MPDSPFHSLTSDTDWSDALAQSEETPVVIFKHSSTCPVSSQAHTEMTELANANDIPIFKVVVQENRAVSDEIESDLDVRHETPQAIVVHDESPVFDTSHFNVTADRLREELRRVPLSTN